MNIDQAGYPYIKSGNRHHRLSRAGKRLIQNGGAGTAEIDAGFVDPDARNSLVFKDGDRWEHEYDSWYDKLQATPEYLVEKCQDRGNNSPVLHEFLRTPLGTAAYHPKPSRKPRPDEVLGDQVNNPNLDAGLKQRVEKYDAEATRAGEREAYQGCMVKVPDARLPVLEKVKCAQHMCRDDTYINGPDGPVYARRRLEDPAHLQDILDGPLSAGEKAKYQHCANKNLYCQRVEYAEVKTKGPLMHITNAGSGECLFIAIAQYIKFANALDNEQPLFLDYNDNTLPADRYRALVPWKVGSIMAYEAGNVLRQRTVDWLASNGEEFGPEGRTIREAMALSLITSTDLAVIKQILDPIGTNITKVYNGFITLFPAYAELLGLTPITAAKNIGEKIKLAADIITTRDALVSENTDPRAIDALMDYYAGFYMKSLRKPNTYAGPLEIFAMSRILNANMHVWAAKADIKNPRYQRLNYMSYNTSPQDPTVNLLLRLKIGANGLVTSGSQHFEILFPWVTGATLAPAIANYDALVKKFPQALSLQEIPIERVEIFVHSLIDLSVRTTATSRYAYDQLVEKNPGFLEWLMRIIWNSRHRLDIATVINGLNRMITRNVPYLGSFEARLENAVNLNKRSDKDLRLALRSLVSNLLQIDLGSIEATVKGYSVHNQILANAIIGLRIPNRTISESAKYNISTLITYIQELDPLKVKPEQVKVLETLRANLIILVICKFTSDMYYYKDNRQYFSLNIEPGSTDLEIMSLLKHYLLMNETMSFDGKVSIPPRAMGQGYQLAEPVILEDTRWRGPQEDIPYLNDISNTTMDDVIVNMNMMGLAHTRSNYELTLSIM